MMTANEIFRELSKVGGWDQEPRKVRWLAARYYSGADSNIRQHAEPANEENGFQRPLLTSEQVKMIVTLR